MASALDPAPKVYGGDLRELSRSPFALVGALVGCGVIVGLMALLAYQLGRDCVATFERSWLLQPHHELYNEVFSDAVLGECDTLEEGPCLQEIKAQWLADERDVHTVPFNLAVTEACPAETREENEFEIEFEPGALVKLGVEIEDEDLPQKVVLPNTQAEAQEASEQVTDDENASPADEQPEPAKKPEVAPKKPVRNRDEKLPPSKLPTRRTTPYDDPPTTTVQKGDPFGEPGGWSELKKDGDPWATAVMEALNKMPVGAFGAKMGEGTSKFQITLCKDGRVKKVQKNGGSLGPADQAAVANAVRSLALPKPPPKVAKNMKGTCAKIKYTFVWSNRGVK